jgi:hypothetical protein
MRRSLISFMVFACAALAAFLIYPGMPAAAPSEVLVAQATVQERTQTRERITVRESSPTTSTTSSRTEIIVQEAPPPPRPEPPMGAPPDPGQVWVPGYWTWNNTWVWASGRWEQPPERTVTWVPGQWLRTDRGWVWQPGQWRQ